MNKYIIFNLHVRVLRFCPTTLAGVREKERVHQSAPVTPTAGARPIQSLPETSGTHKHLLLFTQTVVLIMLFHHCWQRITFVYACTNMLLYVRGIRWRRSAGSRRRRERSREQRRRKRTEDWQNRERKSEENMKKNKRARGAERWRFLHFYISLIKYNINILIYGFL